jgi:hypothetical protein
VSEKVTTPTLVSEMRNQHGMSVLTAVHLDRKRHGRPWWRSGSHTALPRTGLRVNAIRSFAVLAAVVTVVAASTPSALATPPVGYDDLLHVWPTAVPSAQCRADDRIETGVQGEVPLADRDNGRSRLGYNCNIDLVGQLQNEGAGITSASYRHCTYVGTSFPTNLLNGSPAGISVIDATDPARPTRTAVLNEPAALGGTWESLKVNEARGLLVGTAVGVLEGAGYISVYDIATDCAHPRLLNPGPGSQLNMPIPITTHEGDFSPDGNTYWASGVGPGYISAVDLTDPSRPMVVWSGITGLSAHGMGFSPDGDTMYLSNLAGLTMIDVSAIQNRAPRTIVAQLAPHIGQKFWTDGQITQHSIYVTYGGKPHVFSIDEAGSGGAKLFDASDSAHLTQRNAIKLAINLPENQTRAIGSASGNGPFAYESHYCSVDRPVDPQRMACGWIQSGIRVFDISDPDQFREIGYFNPPAQVGKSFDTLRNSIHAGLAGLIAPPIVGGPALGRAILEGQAPLVGVINDRSRLIGADMTSDWCMSPPQFRGDLLYVTCSDNGFLALRIAPGAGGQK